MRIIIIIFTFAAVLLSTPQKRVPRTVCLDQSAGVGQETQHGPPGPLHRPECIELPADTWTADDFHDLHINCVSEVKRYCSVPKNVKWLMFPDGTRMEYK